MVAAAAYDPCKHDPTVDDELGSMERPPTTQGGAPRGAPLRRRRRLRRNAATQYVRLDVRSCSIRQSARLSFCHRGARTLLLHLARFLILLLRLLLLPRPPCRRRLGILPD